jgi:hypothetical protein
MGIVLNELEKLIFSGNYRKRVKEIKDWEARHFSAPSPPHVKRDVLIRNGQPNSVWVETGTFQGDTTEVLAASARFVHSIEPEPDLYKRAAERFSSAPNIRVHLGLSEHVLPALLRELSGDINLWLDGHYSGGITHKGPVDTPILQELAAIEQNKDRFARLTVLIDDVRCFNPTLPEFSSYPSLDVLVNWSRKNTFDWHIEHDIFIARSTA